jgi:hypothetical protein
LLGLLAFLAGCAHPKNMSKEELLWEGLNLGADSVEVFILENNPWWFPD